LNNKAVSQECLYGTHVSLLWYVFTASSGTTTTSGPGGPSQNGLVVSIVIGAFVMFVATVIGSVVSTRLLLIYRPAAHAVFLSGAVP